MRELETPSAELAEDEDIATIVALHATEGARRPAVILLDANLLHSCGSQQAASIGELYPGSKVIVLSDADQELVVLEAIRKGAMGYLVKGESRPHQVVEAVCAAGRGEAILTPRMAGWILDEMT